jgi:hypothetical protein
VVAIYGGYHGNKRRPFSSICTVKGSVLDGISLRLKAESEKT